MKNNVIICECGSSEHNIIFNRIDGVDEVFMSTYLNKAPFFKRLKYGIKYIFGYQCKYGAFDEVVIGKDNKDIFLELYNFLNK